MNYYNYFTEIEETFVRRRGKHLLLSPLDWALIDEWKARGIPLHIVIRAIESVFDVFDKQPPGTRSIKSLFYCREEVDAQYAEWLAARVGKADETASDSEASLTPDAIRQHIAAAVRSLRGVHSDLIAEDVSRAVARLEELATGLTGDAESVEKTLADIEGLLDRALLNSTETLKLKGFQKDVALQLKPYKGEMEPDAYRRTFDLMLLKRLREDLGIPRLGLYYV